MQEIILIRGLPGSGKTTRARALRDNAGHHIYDHFEADDYFTDPKTGEYRYDASKVKEAHHTCQCNVSGALNAGRSVIVSNTFVRLWEMRAYYEMAAAHGCNVRVFICRGEYDNVHGVPADVIDRMRQNWEE